MTETTLRMTAIEDFQELKKLFTVSYISLLTKHYSKAILDAALPKIIKPSPDLLVSGRYFTQQHQNGKLVSCGGWSHDSPTTGSKENRIGHIRHFATHPDYLTKGYAAQIMDKCLESAENEDITQMSCFSTLMAEGFYKSVGFSTVEKITVSIKGVEFPSVFMKREI